jgi:hypothetical protein
MSFVLPGDDEIFARLSLPLSILMREDLPTLLLPIKAYSGLSGFGVLSTDGLEITYAACLIFMLQSNKAYMICNVILPEVWDLFS